MRTKVGSCEETLSDVPFRFSFRRILFNIFQCGLFVNYFTSYAVDIIPYVVDNNTEEVLVELIEIVDTLFSRF